MTLAAYAQLSANGHILDRHTWNSGRNLIHVIWRHADGTIYFGKKLGWETSSKDTVQKLVNNSLVLFVLKLIHLLTVLIHRYGIMQCKQGAVLLFLVILLVLV